MQERAVDGAAVAVGSLAVYPWVADATEITTWVASLIAIVVGIAVAWYRIELARKLYRERKADEAKTDKLD